MDRKRIQVIIFCLIFLFLKAISVNTTENIKQSVLLPYGIDAGDNIFEKRENNRTNWDQYALNISNVLIKLDQNESPFYYERDRREIDVAVEDPFFFLDAYNRSSHLFPHITCTSGPYKGINYYTDFYGLHSRIFLHKNDSLSQFSWRKTRARGTLRQVSADISRAFPSFIGIELEWVIVLTWKDVPSFYCTDDVDNPPRNTFQVAFTTNGIHSFVLLNYEKIEFGSVNIIHRQCMRLDPEILRKKCKTHFRLVTELSNFGKPGKFVYRVDEKEQNETENGLSNASDTEKDKSEEGDCLKSVNVSQVQLKITPSELTQLKSRPLRIEGPCMSSLDDLRRPTCIYHDGENKYKLEGIPVSSYQNHFIYCPVPSYFESLGRKRLALEMIQKSGKVVTLFGFVIVKTSKDDKIKFALENESAWEGNDDVDLSIIQNETDPGKNKTAIKIKWKAQVFKGDDEMLTDLTGLSVGATSGIPSYEKRHVDLRLSTFDGENWTDHGIILENVTNSGECETEINEVINQSIDKAVRSGKGQVIKVDIEMSKDFKEIVRKKRNYVINEGILTDNLSLTKISKAAVKGILTKTEAFEGCRAFLNNALTPDLTGTEACPPMQWIAQIDQKFDPRNPTDLIKVKRSVNSYRQRNPTDSGIGSVCAYDNDGNLRQDVLGGTVETQSPYVNIYKNAVYDEYPFYLCCVEGSYFGNCAKFKHKRPSVGSEGYDTPVSAVAAGDPHISTFDGLSYTFNGVGEFWMIIYENVGIDGFVDGGDSVSFKMQARMEQYEDLEGHLKNASVFTGFVMEQTRGNGKVTVQVNYGKGNEKIVVFLDEELLTVEKDDEVDDFVLRHHSMTLILNPEGSQVTVAFTSGFSFKFNTLGEDEMGLNLMAMARSSMKGKGEMVGLLGKFDGDAENDLISPGGYQVYGNSSLEDIHYKFGLNWMATKNESLFKYAQGKKWEDFSKPEFIPSFLDKLQNDVSDEELNGVCGDNKDCIFDYVTTGSKAVANQTKAVEEEVEVINEILNIPVNLCDNENLLENQPQNGFVELTHQLEGGTLEWKCFEGFEMIPKSSLKCVCAKEISNEGFLPVGEDGGGDLRWICENGKSKSKCVAKPGSPNDIESDIEKKSVKKFFAKYAVHIVVFWVVVSIIGVIIYFRRGILERICCIRKREDFLERHRQ